MITPRARAGIAVLVLSASALVGMLTSEGYTDKAIVPTKNDRPTVGFGSTFRDDGTPVKMGDTITPQKAVVRTLAHIQRDEARLKQCVTAPLTQAEYDTMVDFSYQYGTAKTCASVMVREANAGNYEASCNGYLKYKFSGGYDCSIPGNKVCAGVWTRNQERAKTCKGDASA